MRWVLALVLAWWMGWCCVFVVVVVAVLGLLLLWLSGFVRDGQERWGYVSPRD